MTLSVDQVRRLRMASQRLLPRAGGPSSRLATLVGALGGVQAQDPAAAALALRARTVDLTAEDVRRAREDDRSLALTWCMRGTLHLVAADDLAWLLALLGPIFIRRGRRRYDELGLDATVRAEATRLIRDTLAARAPLTRAELAVALAARGIPVAGQAIAHLVRYAALEGVICFGPMRGVEPTYVLLSDWIAPGTPCAPEPARAELARRYLGGYGPATDKDFAAWSGLSLGEARAALRDIGGEVASIAVEECATPFLIRADARRGDTAPGALLESAVRLLPRYDAYMLGYRGRGFAVAAEHEARIHPGGGQIAASLVVDGRVLGVWRARRHGGRLTIVVTPFAPLDPEVLPGLQAEVSDVGRFLGQDADLSLALPG